MKKLIFFICMLITIVCNGMTMSNTDKSRYILTNQNTVTPELISILEFFGISERELKAIVDKTQKEWLRPAGKERWELDEIAQDKAEKLRPLFEAVGVVTEMPPSEKEYDYAILLGSRFTSAQKRSEYLANLWQQGVRFKSIVILTGCRPLDPKIESCEQLLEVGQSKPATEAEMMKIVWEKTAAPQALKNLPITVVNVPMIQLPDGKSRRPNTADTVDAWLKHEPKPMPGKCVVISSQPFVGYQDCVMRTLLPKTFMIETVGAALKKISNSEVLDNLARWLYQEKIRRSS